MKLHLSFIVTTAIVGAALLASLDTPWFNTTLLTVGAGSAEQALAQSIAPLPLVEVQSDWGYAAIPAEISIVSAYMSDTLDL